MSLPTIGKPAPDFKEKAVLDNKVFNISLSDYDKKYLVLLFFPMDFTFVCPTELIAFSDHLNDFQKINTHVIGCATESHYSHLKWLNMTHKEGGIRGLRIPLIADKSMTIAKKYGVLDEKLGIAHRALFIIDDNGILRQATVNDYQVGRSVSETCRLIKAIQYANRLRENTSKQNFLEVPASSIQRLRTLNSLGRNVLHELTE
ncbi:unnamed protein product [Rotaria sordida]|uniref:thioredoxin-dependent peroxiredoxin n=1 Tax=Rotaria sordida TaxID=392033 RepID=A0A813TS16_9BILA|nr:unnamed protein product [Rotaria sordida]CAF0907104.1 unnamed protein product [Rotaria sordida]